jgi:hypothetical protein
MTTAPAPSPTAAKPGFNARAMLFLLVVTVPVIALGFVFYDAATGTGIKELPDGYKSVDLQRMSTFDFDPLDGTVEDVPPQYRALDGQKIVTEGQMWNEMVTGGTTDEFDLVYSIEDCCLSGESKVQHFVQSQMIDGATRMYDGDVRVRGVLRVDVTRDDSGVTGVYHLDVEEVTPL